MDLLYFTFIHFATLIKNETFFLIFKISILKELIIFLKIQNYVHREIQNDQ